MAVVLAFAIGLLAGSTSVTGTRVSLRASEMGAPGSASALVETTDGCSLKSLAAAQQALWTELVPALNKVKGMQKVGNTWPVSRLLHQSRHAFDNACTHDKEEECRRQGKHCVNYDGDGGYQTTGQCVNDGEFGSLLETEAGGAEVATQDRQGQALESSSPVPCPTSLRTAEAYLVNLIPSLKNLGGFDQVDGTWSIERLLDHANSLADDTCKNPVNQEKCSKQGLECVDVDGPGGTLTSHECMDSEDWQG